MNTSTDRSERTSHVLRDASFRPRPALMDLDSLSGAARRAVDPDALAAAEAAGYEHGREIGYRDGYAAGQAAGLQEVASAAAADRRAADHALEGLARATAALNAAVEAEVAGFQVSLVDAAVELASAILGREVRAADSPGRDALVRALQLTEVQETAVARLHPEDVALLGDPGEVAPGRAVTVVADPSMERGGCVVELGDGTVDARLTTALARVRRELSS